MAYLDWSAYSAKVAALEGDDMEGIEGLESVIAKAEKLSRKEIYPSAESVKAIEEKTSRLADWCRDAKRLAARGDKVFAKTTPAAFKEFIVSDAKRLASLPGQVQGRIVKSEFAFGPFKEYIAEGKMPAESDLPRLQRQWDDVAGVVECLAECGVAEVLDVQLKAKAEPKVEATPAQRRRQNSRKAAVKEEPKKKEPVAWTYVFTFASRGPGIVKAVNRLATCERFTVVDDFTFGRDKDSVAEALSGDEKKNEAGASRRGRRGRRLAADAAAEAETETKKGGIVTDPVLDEPFKVAMTVSVYDFGTLEDDASQAGKKGDEK
jgi:hypothetical protein